MLQYDHVVDNLSSYELCPRTMCRSAPSCVRKKAAPLRGFRLRVPHRGIIVILCNGKNVPTGHEPRMQLIHTTLKTVSGIVDTGGDHRCCVSIGLISVESTLETGYKNTFYPRGKWSYIRFILICNPYSGQIARVGSWEEPSYNRIILVSGLLISGFQCI